MEKKCGHNIEEHIAVLQQMRLPKKLVDQTRRMHELGLCNIEPNDELVKVTVSATLGGPVPEGYQCMQCHAKNPYSHKMSCDPPRKMKRIGGQS